MTSLIKEKINIYGPNFTDLQLRKEKLKLQNYEDLLTGEKIDFKNAHYHHIN